MTNHLDEIQLVKPGNKAFDEILTPGALDFVGKLHRQFNLTRELILQMRREKQQEIDEGKLPNFLPETRFVRNGDWEIATVPQDLQDRRVEITGPAGDRKMVINAFNSGAKAFMADFEDANSPTWENTIQGQINLRDAIRGTIEFTNPDGKEYRLKQQIATLMVRPRGWHLEEKHVMLGGKPISASLFDFGLYLYHNAKTLIAKGSGPYFYLPKLESHHEARLWNEVFVFAQDELGIPQGTIKATVLIETILATFEADEILYELREHSAGLNCGRWDYIFSYIKKLKNHEQFMLPDRAQVSMSVPFMKTYTEYVIRTCHKRNAHAMGGMAAQIPIRNDAKANEEAMNKVRADKIREVQAGHDGTWVAHPGLVPVAMEAFNEGMPGPNQLHIRREDVRVTAEDLLQAPSGEITEEGLRINISVGIQYIEAWFRGFGAVPIFNLMEDAATAEISRTQVWQWIRHPKAILTDGRKVTLPLVESLIEEEMQKLKSLTGSEEFAERKFNQACQLFKDLIEKKDFVEFLTLPGYEQL